MKKLGLIFTFASVLSLSGCTNRSHFYKITINGYSGMTTSHLVPEGAYPTLYGYTFNPDEAEYERFSPFLTTASSNKTYNYMYKVTLNGAPGYSEPIVKYFEYDEIIDFSDEGIQQESFSDTTLYATYDMELNCRNRYVNIRLSGIPYYGDIVKTFSVGDLVDFSEYGIERERFTDNPVYANTDCSYSYRYYVEIYDPSYGYRSKYYTRGQYVDFYNDFGVDEIRYTDFSVYVYGDQFFEYRYRVYFDGCGVWDDYEIYRPQSSYIYYPYDQSDRYDGYWNYHLNYWYDYNNGVIVNPYNSLYSRSYDLYLTANYYYYN